MSNTTKIEIERRYFEELSTGVISENLENRYIGLVINFYIDYARRISFRYRVSEISNIIDEEETLSRAQLAVHDALLILRAKISEGSFEFDAESGFGKFMHTTIRFLIMNQSKNRINLFSVDELIQLNREGELGTCELDVESETNSIEIIRQLIKECATELLSDKQYELFVNGYLDGYDNEELANIHNYNHHRTACKKLSQAKSNFNKRLYEIDKNKLFELTA